MDHVEVVLNGQVVASHVKLEPTKNLDIQGKLKVKDPGWILLRAWNSSAQPEVQDIYPYASTNPIYIDGSDKSDREMVAGKYFLKWLVRLETLTNASDAFRNEAERSAIIEDIRKARLFYERAVKAANP